MRTLFKGIGRASLPLALCLGVLFMPDIAWAQAAGDSNEAIKNFAQIAASLVHIISAIAILIMQFMPALWGSELITGDAVTNGLRTLWVYVRNLTNIAFVGMILFLAFSNLVTSGKGIKDWNIKSKLGPVILGLVAINFSLLAMKVLVDVVHVGTVALLSIADPVIEARGVNNVADYYTRTVDTETFEACDASGGGANCKPLREIVNSTFCASGLTGDSCLFQIKNAGELQSAAAAMGNPEKRNIMMAFGTFFMKLESLPLLSAESGGLLNVLDSTIFSIIFGLAYLLALIAIFIVLLIRVVMMWLFIIFSPVLVTGWVFGFNIPLLSDQFWKYLLVPVKAAGALAFGFVMLATLETMTVPKEIYVDMIDVGPPLKKFWGNEEFGGWSMIWKVLTVVLFWKVVFDFALKDIEGVSGITEKIKGFGQAAGSAALTLGADQVKIPGTGVEGKETTLASFMGSGSITNRLNQAKQAAIREDGSQLGSAFGGGGDERRGQQGVDTLTAKTANFNKAASLRTAVAAENITRAQMEAALAEPAYRDKMINAMKSGGVGYTAAETADGVMSELERHGVYSAPATNTATTTGNTPTTPAAVNVQAIAKVEETITVDGGTTVDLNIANGGNIDKSTLSNVFNQANLSNLTATRLQAIASQIAGAANITDTQEIAKIRQDLVSIASGT